MNYQFDIQNNGVFNFYFGDGSGTASNAIATFGVWQHVVVTWDGTTVKFYRNGVFDVNDFHTQAGVTSQPTADAVNIGSYVDGTGAFFSGSIDDVRIYNRVLSGGEVQQLFLMGH
jgi:hypothetical protein